MRNHSYENDFDLHENETACRTHFHMKCFALRLVLFETEAKENLEMAYCRNHTQIKLQQRDILFAFQPRKPSY